MSYSQKITWAAAGVIGLLLISPSQAASVTASAGEVLINNGVGFKKITGPLELAPGDQIMVGAAGSAQVTFADGCSVPVAPGQVVQIGAQSPCATQKPSDTAQSAADGAAPGAAGGIGVNTILIGGVVVAAGAGLAIGLSGGGKDKTVRPASP